MRSRQAFLATAFIALSTLTASAIAQPPKPRPDLADTAQGHYAGDIISDARGSSQSDVAITVTKIGKNRISVVADNPHIPKREFNLTKAMATIQNASGTEVFLLDLAKSPHRLDLTIDDASWSGQYEGALEPAPGGSGS